MTASHTRRFSRAGRLAAALLFASAASSATAQEPHPFARDAPPSARLVNGTWNGVDLERRSNCTNSQNNGTRGTYAQFDVATDATGVFSVAQTGITGLTCAYSGRYTVANGALGIDGTYNCSDGKQGNFHATKVDVNGISMTLQMSVQLTGGETCTIDAILGLTRFYP
ncbi:MAG TPA: hypothetical protein VFE23_04385 [Usitatibacter sp.]|nr:hypothetical protein [Usitatibacter sp.]